MAPRLLIELLRDSYSADDLRRVQAMLDEHDTLAFARLRTGLFSAATVEGADRSSGYHYVWSRDNVYVGRAHFVAGKMQEAADVARALLTFYAKYRSRFDAIISGAADPNDVSQRPHVRFDGETLTEITSQRWSHAQNDAIGYVLWYCATLLSHGVFQATTTEWETLWLFPAYFKAIRYWEDQDSGHWEEVRKISASSVGVVVAGLDAWLRLVRDERVARPDALNQRDIEESTTELAARGTRALDDILPSECIQDSRRQRRPSDAALLFLLYPLRVVAEEMEDQIIANCERDLKGEIGFRRYNGDSYWAPDYDIKLSPQDRTRDFSEDMETRDALLPHAGQEAQWGIFDAIVSAHFGLRYARSGNAHDRERQTEYLNRALRQIATGDERTPPWRCPELYYLRRGVYVPNPHVPLQWAQANLLVALHAMRETIKRPS